MSKYIDPHSKEVIECNNHGTNCKFCKKPITLQIASSYDLGDPLKLIPLACCNECADLRKLRRRIERKVQLVCAAIQVAGSNATDGLLSKSRESLTILTKDYARVISNLYGMDGMAWDEECVNLLMDKPEKWHLIIEELWKLFRDTQKYQTTKG